MSSYVRALDTQLEQLGATIIRCRGETITLCLHRTVIHSLDDIAHQQLPVLIPVQIVPDIRCCCMSVVESSSIGLTSNVY